jgi:hypothetical protein
MSTFHKTASEAVAGKSYGWFQRPLLDQSENIKEMTRAISSDISTRVANISSVMALIDTETRTIKDCIRKNLEMTIRSGLLESRIRSEVAEEMTSLLDDTLNSAESSEAKIAQLTALSGEQFF